MGYLFYFFTKAHLVSSRKIYLVTSADYFLKTVSSKIKTSDDLAPAARFFIRQYSDHMDYDLIVLDSEARIVSDSSGIDSMMVFLPPYSIDDDPHIAKVLKSGEAVSWTADIDGIEYLYQCNPIFIDNKVAGAIKLTMSTEDFLVIFDILRNYFFTTFLCSLLAAVLLALLFVKILIKPVVKVRDMAIEITKGSFGNRLEIYSNDELGDLSRDINKMADELARLEKVRNLFLANVSHELRTPLTIIKGFAVTLMGGSELNPADKHCLEMIDKEADRLTRLVNELLELSRIKTGRFSLNLSKCNIEDLIEFVTFQLSSKAQELKCEIITNFSDKLPLIEADSDKLKEVLINLIDNALKYSTSSKSESKVYIKCEAVDFFIKITIKDSGQGIPQKELDHVFERFFRGESRNQKVEGVGLGLAIVKEIINAHNGEIYVESPEGEGCSFIIKLPTNYQKPQ